MSSSTSTAGAERTLFLGPRIPHHIKILHKLLSNADKRLFRQLVKLAVLEFEGRSIQPEMYLSIKKISDGNCDIDSMYGALHSLIRCALSFPEASLKCEVFKEDLRELKIPEMYIEDLSNIVYGSKRLSITENFHNSVPHFPKLEKFRWRIDVAISTSTLSRVLEPAIVIEVELSNGQKETFEVHPSQFHRLRFAVATLLKEMESLEMKNVLKL